MPLFDFECQDCGEQFEALVRHNSGTITCPACESSNLEQQTLTSFSVSSETTRQANLKTARTQNSKRQRDWQVAQREYERDHHH